MEFSWPLMRTRMSLNHLSFKRRMFLLVGVFLLGLLGTHVMYGVMLSILRVNGPVYERIQLSQGIVANIQPTNYNASYVTALHLLEETDPAKRSKLMKRMEQLEAAYEANHT